MPSSQAPQCQQRVPEDVEVMEAALHHAACSVEFRQERRQHAELGGKLQRRGPVHMPHDGAKLIADAFGSGNGGTTSELRRSQLSDSGTGLGVDSETQGAREPYGPEKPDAVRLERRA